MDRSLMQLGIADLEALFAQSKADTKVLKQLEHELQHRKVSRALALLAEVRKSLSSVVQVVPTASVKPNVPAKSTQQLELHERSPAAPASSTAVGPQPSPTQAASLPVPPVAPSQSPLPSLGMEEACKILKVTLASTWETIEHRRRELVEQAHPARVTPMSTEKRSRVLDEAKRVNAAYAVLSAVRCGIKLL